MTSARPSLPPHRAASSPRKPASADLRRAHRRLARIFASVLVAAGPAALMQACSADETLGPLPTTASSGASVSASASASSGSGGSSATSSGSGGATGSGGSTSDAGDGGDAADCGPVLGIDATPDGDLICEFGWPCGLDPRFGVQGCELYTDPGDAALPLGCRLVEGAGCEADAYSPPDGGFVRFQCFDCQGSGRRTAGLRRAPGRASTAAGAYFAKMAHGEAASVAAFRRMAAELEGHGAPGWLVAAAARASRDEERHARVMGRLARSNGAAVPAVKVRAARPRSLEAMARENAVEGAVDETFGALLLRWQADHACDPAVRNTLARVAADEARHAALSWAALGWVEPRLDAAARRRIHSAQVRAIGRLRRSEGVAGVPVALGRPSPAVHRALVDGLASHLGLA